MMGVMDSWIFSAHVVVGIMSDNRTSLPLLVPGFLCLCSAIVFGPVSHLDLPPTSAVLTVSDMQSCCIAYKPQNGCQLPPQPSCLYLSLKRMRVQLHRQTMGLPLPSRLPNHPSLRG